MTSSRKRTRGATLVELLTASFISLLVMAACVALLYQGSASWAKGMGEVNAETDAQMAVRILSDRLSEAMAVTVAADGNSLSYELPKTDGSGNFIIPLTWDGVTRTAQVSGSMLTLTDGGSKIVVAHGVTLTDPYSKNGTAPYKPFIGAGNPLTQQVTIELATQWTGFRNKLVSSRDRETVFCRNVQEPTLG